MVSLLAPKRNRNPCRQFGESDRYSVDRPTPSVLATSAAGWPASTSSFACSSWSLVRARRRPIIAPRDFAAAMPAFVRSPMRARSNSARLAMMWKTRRPPAEVVSIASLMLRKPTPRASRPATVSSRCGRERPSRSSRQTMRTSPAVRLASAAARPERFEPAPPPAVSSKIFSDPAAFSASTCTLVSWSAVLTRAYPIKRDLRVAISGLEGLEKSTAGQVARKGPVLGRLPMGHQHIPFSNDTCR